MAKAKEEWGEIFETLQELLRRAAEHLLGTKEFTEEQFYKYFISGELFILYYNGDLRVRIYNAYLTLRVIIHSICTSNCRINLLYDVLCFMNYMVKCKCAYNAI